MSVSPSLSRGRKRLNLMLVKPHWHRQGRRYVRFSRRMDAEPFVRRTAFTAKIEAWVGRRVDNAALLASALTAFMISHRAWASGSP